MKCPLCESKTKVSDSRMAKKDRVRTHLCPNCLTSFKTVERIDYGSLDRYVLDRLHERV